MNEHFPHAPEAPPWAFRKLPGRVGSDGWVEVLPRHVVSFVPRGPLLVVTFDNMKSRETPGPRVPWAFDFLETLGASHLGVMMRRRNDWYRHAALFDLFDDLKARGFFAGFDEVVFYGSSMGGYGACAFASAAPGARVVAFFPQSRLDKDVVPWEDRYDNGLARGDWTDPRYRDAALGLATVDQADIFADPYDPYDAGHMARLMPSGKVTWHRTPYCSHRAARLMSFMPGFSAFMRRAVLGTMTTGDFHRFYAQRKTGPAYLRAVALRCLDQGRPDRAERVVDYGEGVLPGYRFKALRRRIKAAREA